MLDEKFKKEVIEKSGNNLHEKTVEILEEADYKVNISSYYYDDSANKPREIDLIACKEEDVQGSFAIEFGRPPNKLFISLFIECKYFIEPIIFRLHQQTEEEKWQSIITKGINNEEAFSSEKHSFLRLNKIGKLYDTSKSQHNDLFNAITQPIKSLIFFKEADNKSKSIYFPVVVFDGPGDIYYMDGNHITESPKNLACFGINYSYKNVHTNALQQQYFNITFVKCDKFYDFLQSLEHNELANLKKYLSFKDLMSTKK